MNAQETEKVCAHPTEPAEAGTTDEEVQQQEATPEKWHAHEALMAADGNMEEIERVVGKPISPQVRAKMLAALREHYLAKVAPDEVLGQEMLDLVGRIDRMRPGYRQSLCRELRTRAGEPVEASDIDEPEADDDTEDAAPDGLPSTGWSIFDAYLDQLPIEAKAAMHTGLKARWVNPLMDAAEKRLAAHLEPFQDPDEMERLLSKEGIPETAGPMTFWLVFPKLAETGVEAESGR